MTNAIAFLAIIFVPLLAFLLLMPWMEAKRRR